MIKKEKFTNNFYGNVNGLQIQQGDVNSSSQEQNIYTGIDSGEIANIIKEIRKYDKWFDDEYKENAYVIRLKLNEIEALLKQNQPFDKIKQLLLDIKNISINAAGGVISSGIVAMIEKNI